MTDLEKADNNPKVGDRLLVLEYKSETMEKRLDGLCEDVNKIMTNHLPHIQDGINDLGNKITERFDKFDEKLEKKYASKLTEKIVYGLVTLIISAVVIALISLVVTKWYKNF